MNNKVSNGLKLTLLFSSMMTIMANAVIAPALPLITKSFEHIANVAILSKMIMSIPSLTIAFTAPIMGRLSDKYGRKKILIASLLIYALAGTTGFYLENIFLILVFRLIFGIGIAGIMTSITALIGDIFNGHEQSKFLGLQGTFMALGGIIFISSSGFLAEISWHYSFLIYLFSIPITILAVFKVKEPIKERLEQNKPKYVIGNNEFSQKTAWLIYISGFIATLLFYLMPIQISFLLIKMDGISYSNIGIMMSVGTVAQAILSSFYGKIKSKLNFPTIFAICFFFLAVGYSMLSYSTEIWQSVIALFISGMGVSWIMPNTNQWMLSLAPVEQRGKLLGNVSTAIYLGMFFSPIFIQPFTAAYGIRGSFFSASMMLFALLGIYLIIGWRYAKKGRGLTKA